MTDIPETEEDKQLVERITSARNSRARFAPTYNAFFDLAAPDKQRVQDGSHGQQERNPSDQDNIFDSTLQDSVQDFASDLGDEFTPGYRPWTKHEATDEVLSEFKVQVEEYVTKRNKAVHAAIRRSSFEEASQECYIDAAIGPWAMMVRRTRAGLPIDCEYVPLSELLIWPGPFGGTGGRAWEREVEVRHLDTVFPNVDWDFVNPTKEQRRQQKTKLEVIEVFERDFTKSVETWAYYVVSQGRVRYRRTFRGRGSCALIVGRIRVSSPSAFGVGPGVRALAPARTLNEMAYLNLKRIGKVVDPPGVFVDPSGIFNPEGGGFEAGRWYEAGEGSAFDEMAPSNDQREVWFEREDERQKILRALYQDKPYQRGDTPPTAAQWLGEEARSEKRKGLPRSRIHAEWQMPLLDRFEWILEKRNELEELVIERQQIEVRPVSPLSKASDVQEAQIAEQIMDGMAGKGIDLGLHVDVEKTYGQIKAKMGDELIQLRSAEEVEQIRAQQTASAAPAPEGGQ